MSKHIHQYGWNNKTIKTQLYRHGVLRWSDYLQTKEDYVMGDTIQGTIQGKLVSKANSRMAVPGRTKTGKAFTRFIKSQSALDFEQSALWQLKKIVGRQKPLSGELGLEATVYYESRRPDLDVSLLMDVLEHAGVYDNDRQLHEICTYKKYDKENPRVEFSVYKL